MLVSRPAHPSSRGEHQALDRHRLRRGLRLLLALVLTLGLAPLQFLSVAQAAGIVVTTTADTIDAAGTCTAVTLASLPGPDGQTSLREAVCAANNNAGADTITFLVNGTFALTGAANEDNGGSGDLDIKQSLAINGNGAANTIIDGNGNERIFDVFPSAASTFGVSNLTLQNGDTRSTSFKEGGAMYLHNNVTSTFSAIQVINNFSGANGAIENRGTLTINNSVISNNQTNGGGTSVAGGGIHNAGTLTIDNSTIANNSVTGEGGGIATTTGAAVVVTITDSTISDNTASVTGGGLGNGGGISTTGNDGTINITNSTISGNRADNNGGGAAFVSVNANSVNLTNVTISNNTADNDNNGSGAGGGFAQSTTTVTLRNTLVAGNFNSTAATRDDISGAVVSSSSFNLVGDGTGSSGITNGVNNNQVGSGASPINPQLGPLVNNGGSTATHALLAGSPALDTGNNAVCPATDQRGVPRPGGAACDIGSYELNDTTPPDTTITGNPTNPSNSTSATFTFTGSDNVTPAPSLTFQCQIDGGGFSACTSPRTYTGLADGSHTFQVRAIDQANNTDPTPATYTWIVDATPPNTTITANPTNPSTSTTASFSFIGNDGSGTGVASFQCQLDGGGFSTCTSPQTYTGLSQGSHTFRVRAIDGAGNMDPTPASFTWVVDTIVPDTTITANPTNPSASANASFSFTGSDPGGSGVASFQCQIDGGGFSACTSPRTYTGLADGSHTFQVRAVDAAGNLDPTPASFTWVIDTTGPDTTLTATPPNPSASANASFSFTGNDGSGTGVVGFECQIDGGAFIACASPRTYVGLSDGSHTFVVRAVDAAGNPDSTPASFTWVIDTTPPPAPVVITPANGSSTNNTQPLVSGTAEANSTVTVFLDGTAAGTTTADPAGNWTFTPPTPLSDGSHTVRARATDAVGNTSVDSNTNTFIVDTVAPDTTITANPTNPSGSANTSFSFTGSDPGGSGVAGFECQLDGGGFSTCTSPQTYTGLADGSHAFQVRAIDAGGNVDPTPASFTWLIDATEPDTTLTANPTNPSASANASFSFTGNDGSGTGVVGFECQLDGGGFSTCTSSQTYTGRADGSHTFQVRAVDIANNRDSTPATFTWVVDTVAPDMTITANPPNPSGSANASFTFTGDDGSGSGIASFECQLDGAGFSACTSPQTYTGLADGSHTFQVRAIDTAGNVDNTPANFTWLIDTTAPTVAFGSTAPDPTNLSPIPVTVTFSENVTGFTAADITTGNGTVNNFAGSGSVYTFDLVPAGQGLVTADIAAGVAQDVAGNGNTAAAQFSRTYDSVAPTVTINKASGQADPTGVSPINFTVVFNEPVNGFGDSAADVTITGTAGATTASVTGSGTTYNVAITGMTGIGTVVVTIPAGAAQDLATNPNAASTSTDNTVDFDPVGPVVTGIVRADPSPTSAASVHFTVTFSKNVFGADAGDFNFSSSGVLGANVTGVTGSGTTWTVTVSTGTGDGTLRLNLVDNDSITDSAGNQLGGSGRGNGDFTAGQVYTIDKTAPSVASIAPAGANPTNTTTVAFTVTFSEVVSNVDTTDFNLITAGVSSAGVTGVTGAGATWTVTVSTGSGDGTIRLDVVDDDTIVDVNGHELGGSGAGNGNFTTGEVYTIDKTAPTASNLVTPAATTGSTTYTFTVNLSDNQAINVGSLDGNDIRVTGPGGYSQPATLVGVNPATNGSPRTATYQIVPPGGAWDAPDGGAYTVTLQPNQVRDTAGNPASGAVLGTFQVSLIYRSYLPFMAKPAQPDLVAKISLVPNKRTFAAGEPVVVIVTVTNQGTGPTVGFWVDLFINPATPPTAANVTWNTTCTLNPCYGIAWYVPGPLAPGASITLSSANGMPGYTIWPGYFAAGTTDLYVYVDSWNPSVATGAVLEANETNNSDHIGGLTVTGPNPALRDMPATVLTDRPALLRR